MKSIVLDSVCIENFRSFVGPTAIEFTRTNGLKFIAGANQVEPELGANGAGKTTIFDAICYALYGVSIKGLRASELRAYGTRSMAALVLLLVDNQTYWVQRVSPPERITINDCPATQREVDELVGLSCDRFLSSVVFGQAVPLFVDLPKPARGDLLDEVLRLEAWIRAAGKATERYNELSGRLTELRIATARLEERLAAQPDLGELRVLEHAWANERDERLAELTERLEKTGAERQQLEKRIRPVSEQSVTEARARFDEYSAKLIALRDDNTRLQTEYNRIGNDIAFFAEHNTCPTCGQDITKEFCDEHLRDLQKEETRYQGRLSAIDARIKDTAATANDLENAWQRVVQDVAAAERTQAVVAEQLRSRCAQCDDLQCQIDRIGTEKNPYGEQRKAVAAERRRIAAELTRQSAAEDQAAAGLATVDYWRQGFRRVREFCLDNVLRELTLETRNSLLVLGLHGWNVHFTTTTPTQRGTMRFGVECQVEPPAKPAGNFDTLSGGEGQRVRLAVSLGLASLIQRWSGTSFNWEVYDEPTAWLSEQGVEDLLDCLAYRAEAHNKSIYICDHRALSHSGFAESYLVTKDASGSHWERV